MPTTESTLTTTEGDTIDEICWRHYGSTVGGIVEATIEANPHLLSYSPRLPAGLSITMPAQSTEPLRRRRLWPVN